MLFLCLVTWKVFRTDWVVVCSLHNDNMTCKGYRNVCGEPEVSPLWELPSPNEVFEEYCGKNRRTRPDWEVIGMKMAGPFFLLGCMMLAHRLVGRGGLVWRLIRESIAESRRQWAQEGGPKVDTPMATDRPTPTKME